VVLDNQVATLQVGDQVPVATASATVISGAGAPVVNTIDYRNTGVILRVVPRINANGNVLLDVEQEISNVAAGSAGSLTPTASMRCVSPRRCARSCKGVSVRPIRASCGSNRMFRISVVDRLTVWRERPLAVCIIGLVAVTGCAVSVMVAPGLPGYFGAGLALIAVAIAVIDARWFIIPNELSAAGFALGLASAATHAPHAIWEAVGIAMLRGAVLALLFLGL